MRRLEMLLHTTWPCENRPGHWPLTASSKVCGSGLRWSITSGVVTLSSQVDPGGVR